MYIIRYQVQRHAAHQITDVSWRLDLFAVIPPRFFSGSRTEVFRVLQCSARVKELSLREKSIRENEVKVVDFYKVDN